MLEIIYTELVPTLRVFAEIHEGEPQIGNLLTDNKNTWTIVAFEEVPDAVLAMNRRSIILDGPIDLPRFVYIKEAV